MQFFGGDECVTPNRLERFDDRQAALVNLVLTAVFLFVGEFKDYHL
jgi:hypothetical protein